MIIVIIVVINLLNRFVHFPFTSLFIFRNLSWRTESHYPIDKSHASSLVGEDLLVVFIIGASSLKAGIESTSGNQRKELSRISFFVKGLSLHRNSISPILNLGFLLRRGTLKFKTNIVLWHDVISHTITKHRLNNNRAETVDSLIATLQNFSHRISAIIYCQREGSSFILEELLVITAAKK